MASPKLSNYLRSHRKRLGLSQDEVAYLLGVESGAKVCRHERFVRDPSIETMIAYEVIFQKPIRELFPGLYLKIEQEVAERAEILHRRTAVREPTRHAAEKLQMLIGLAARRDSKYSKTS